METGLILGITCVACFGLIILTIFLCQKNVKMKRDSVKKSTDISNMIMKNVLTNNTYDRLLDVLVNLEDDLKKQNMDLNVNFKGYISNGSEK